VRRGSTLELANVTGNIAVRVGSGNRVRVVADHAVQDRVTVRAKGPKVIVDCDTERMVPATVDYEITVPVWMSLDLSGFNSDITVDGVGGDVKAETVQGDIVLIGSTGSATLNTVQGGVRVEKARGRVEASAINGPVRIENADGAIVVESVNGDIVLSDVASDSVDASTVNGPVRFVGTLKARGLYRLASHNGSIRMAVPENANANLRVATYRGGFDCSFPISTHETKKGREYQIRLGNGGAAVTLETFQGWVILRRPGELMKGGPEEHEDDHSARMKQLQKQLRTLERQRERDEGEDDE
jgi:DUF4097 and DUF4098 domain-containing protein YvlB